MTRRESLRIAALGGLASASCAVASPVPSSVPLLCLYSKAVAKLSYSELGDIVKQIGFDGVDLTVRPGGHVEPRLSNVDLVRAYESIAGSGLECPLISTALNSSLEPTALAVLAISGRTSIPLFRVGDWRSSTPLYRREIASLVSIGSRYGIAMALHNYTSENAGQTDWSLPETLAGFDPRWVGAFFDAIHHGGQWPEALRPLLPRLRAVAVKDFKITEDGVVPCALGEGALDLRRLFGMLADSGYAGPLSLRLEYNPVNELSAIEKDYRYARKMLESAYVKTGSGSGAGSGSGIG